MNYEIVELEEKTVVGIGARTKNSDPNMRNLIGGLWQEFYGKGIFQNIQGKINEKSIGLYTHYENGVEGEYDVIVCCETVENTVLSKETKSHKIPGGKYGRFIVQGDAQKAVSEFWLELWEMNIERAYIADFEEYQPGGTMENGEIHMYISLK